MNRASCWPVVCAAIFLSCEWPFGPDSVDHENLIPNPSFEQNGRPSLEGWHVAGVDTALVNTAPGAPIPGNRYAASLLNGWGPLPSLQATIAVPAGLHRFHLSVWSKAESEGLSRSFASGSVRILTKVRDSLALCGTISFSDSLWTGHTMLQTIDVGEGDTIIVSLSSGHTQWSGGRTLFDLVYFCRLD